MTKEINELAYLKNLLDHQINEYRKEELRNIPTLMRAYKSGSPILHHKSYLLNKNGFLLCEDDDDEVVVVPFTEFKLIAGYIQKVNPKNTCADHKYYLRHDYTKKVYELQLLQNDNFHFLAKKLKGSFRAEIKKIRKTEFFGIDEIELRKLKIDRILMH